MATATKTEDRLTEIVIDLDTEDRTDQDEQYIQGIVSRVMQIANSWISRHPNIDPCSNQGLTEILKDIRRKYKADINNIRELDILWDIYTIICCTCKVKPTLKRYCIMVNVHHDTINSWIHGEYGGRVASGHSDSAQKWRDECESTLYDEVIRTGNIGCMFALKANYGYRDNIQIVSYDDKPGMPTYSRQEIEQRAKMVDSLPGSAEDLPD